MAKDNIHQMRENIIKMIEAGEIKKAHKNFKEYIELLIFSLLKEDPFYANVIILLNRRYDLRFPAPAGVSMNRTYFDLWLNMPRFIVYSVQISKDILRHECLHILNLHLLREKMYVTKYDRTTCNIGMDASINQYLPTLGKTGSGFITLDSLEKDFFINSVEAKRESEYYIDLINNACHKNPKAQNNLNKMRGNNNHKSDSGSIKGNSDSGDDGQSSGEMGDELSSGPTNNHDVWRESDKVGNIDDMKDMVRDIANEAAEKSRGKVPGHIESLIKKLNEKPVISWQKVLKLYLGSVKIPYRKTILRRDRRQPNRYDIRGRISDRTVIITVIIDTSGSVSDEEIKWIFREIFGIIRHVKFQLHIIDCDMDVVRVYTAKSEKDIKLNVKGRGGTAFSPAIEYINENLPKTDIAIYFTDGGGERILDPAPKGYKLLWVLTTKASDLSVKEKPYGQVKELNFKNSSRR